jgi:polyhydroxyalkanoate synthase
LALWKSGLLPWSGPRVAAAAALRDELAGVDPDDFATAVDRAARARLGRFMAGVTKYRRHGYHRDLADPPVLWQEGAARLLDYGATAPGGTLPASAPTLLVVPSLINRAFVLDLSARRSLLRYLAAAGIRPLLLDWGHPGEIEASFTLTDYIAGPLEAAFDRALELARRPVGVMGYCMGGLLALALALRRQADVSHLALLATPWDFHADPALARRVAGALPWLQLVSDAAGRMPVDVLQSLFYALDPYLVIRKFDGLADADPASEAFTAFVALEDWINDGIALSVPVARECLAGWYAGNSPARLAWRVAGRAVDPARFARPALVVVPAQDRIVPPASAQALAQALPAAETLLPPVGHIGMVVSAAARRPVWEKLAGWCRRHG